MHNMGAIAFGGKTVAPYKASNKHQEAGMDVAFDLMLFLPMISGRSSVGGVAAAEAEETTLIASESATVSRNTKHGGTITQPNPAPTGTVVNQNGATIQRYTRDHGPAHLHVQGKGPNTRIGQNGKPLRGDPALSGAQKRVVQNNLSNIRKTVRRVMKEHRYNNQ